MLTVVLSCPQAAADCAGTASSGQSALEGGLPVHAAQLMASTCMALYTSPPVCEPQAGVKLVLEGVTKNGLAALTRTCGVPTLQEAQGWSHSPTSMPDMQGCSCCLQPDPTGAGAEMLLMAQHDLDMVTKASRLLCTLAFRLHAA